jgi:polysaccharide export outer membrane protein
MSRKCDRIGALLAGVLLLTLFGCGLAPVRIDPDTEAYLEKVAENTDGANILTRYHVGPEDVLEIRVWADDTLSTKVAVRPDGMISLPLIGDVYVAGKTASEISGEVEKLLEEFKASPQVDVNIAEINSYRIYILGEVEKPGMVQVRNFTTLLQAIALVGGPTRFASDEILVLRKNSEQGGERVLRLNYRLLSSDKVEHRPYNLVLLPGDTVIVK